MKFDRHKAFPYPVVRPYSDDYKDIEFQTTVDFSLSKEKVELSIDFAISSDEIVAQIEKGNAEYIAVISCRDTYFRELNSSTVPQLLMELDVKDLRGEVKVDSYIVVKKPIKEFVSPDINLEFGSGPFSFSPGQVLAQDETQVFYIDRDLFKPVISVVDLVKKEHLSEGEWTIGFEEDHIQIEVNSKMKEAIDDARNSKLNRIVLLNSIYFAAVTQAVQKIRDASGECEGKKWAEVIRRQAHNKGIEIEAHDAYVVAQRLMKYPLSLLDLYVFKGTN